SNNTCNNSIGSTNLIAIPQPANSHVHSGDNGFPEYGIGKNLHELVSYPDGLKHKLLNSLPYNSLINGIMKFYETAYNMGLGLLIDFREGGGVGCKASKDALSILNNKIDVLILGRPGPDFPRYCDGLGISSPLDYNPEEIVRLSNTYRPSMTHVAEDPESREKFDFEISLKASFDAIIHGLYLNEKDFIKLSQTNTYLIFCPTSNLWHGLRIPPIDLALKYNIKFSVGTDNASWFLPDIYKEVNELLLFLRLKGIKGEDVAKKLLESIYLNGYYLAKIRPKIIEEGNFANFLLIDGDNSNILRSINIYNAIVKRVMPGFIKYRIDRKKIYSF
ncbi:MAG: hypothetical protein RAK17_06595, partial [Caldisphaera sp.]|nr:hypothetical protein [Caldisphaera sp.]